jgi:hypothetical protein
MKNPAELKVAAGRYRRLGAEIADQRVAGVLIKLAGEYEGLAAALEEEQHIRERAYAIWEDQGRPHGWHAEHWAMAERELTDGDYSQGDGNLALKQRSG